MRQVYVSVSKTAYKNGWFAINSLPSTSSNPVVRLYGASLNNGEGFTPWLSRVIVERCKNPLGSAAGFEISL